MRASDVKTTLCGELTLQRLANICSMATLTAQSAELTALLKNNPEPHRVEVEVAINIALIVLTTFSHCLGVIVSKIICYLLLRLFNQMM